ncbi:MAG: hypothetical protein IKA85_00110 [Clostridia bacterium]|nr:hypothetical protein [Clostridia bacterium]
MRKLLTRILVFLLAVTSVFGLTGLKSVKAEEVAVSGMQIVGASLRSPAGEDAYTGIRFETTITKEAFNALKEANEGKVISFGTKISDVDGFSPVYVSYVTSENMLFVEEGNNYKYYASITFNNEDFALDVLKMLRNDDTLTTIEGATEEELLKIEKYKQASYAELLKATSYYEIDGTKYYTASLVRSMRMVANWYVEGDILNETEKAFISSKNYFTAVTPITGYNYVEQDGEIVNDNGEAYVFATKAQVAYKAQNVPVVDGKLDLSNVAFDEELGEKVTLYIFDEDNKVSELTAKYVTEYITTVAEMKAAVEIGDLSAEIAAEGYYAGNTTTGEYGDLYNDGYYVLGCDLDFTGYKIEHAVSSTTATNAQYGVHRPFVGTFDGQGYALKNVEVVNGVGIFGQISHKANIKNLAIIDYNFPAGNGTPMGVLAYSESVNSDHDTGGAVFEDLYITLGTLNNNNSKWRRRGMLFGQLVNPRTVLKNIVVEANVTHATYETNIGQPTLFYYANEHVYIEGKSLYQHKANNSTSIVDSALANSIENLFVISKDTTNSGLTFRMTAASSGNPASVAYNDKDMANVIETNAITSSGSYYWPEYYYTDSEGNATFVKPENYKGENNIVMRRYDDYTAFASDTKTDKTSLNKFNSNMWVVSNGAVYYKGLYKEIVKSVVLNKASEEVDEIVFTNTSEEYSFSFNDGKAIDTSNIVITLQENDYLEVSGNKVIIKENATIPTEAVNVEIVVSQAIGNYTATATYIAKIQKETKEITAKTYFDLSTSVFNIEELTGDITNLTISYNGNSYPITLIEGKVQDFTQKVILTGSATEKVLITIGDNSFELTTTNGVFPSLEATAVIDDVLYNFTDLHIANKILKNKEDLAYLILSNDSTNKAEVVILGNNIDATGYTHNQTTNTSVRNKAFNGIFDGQGYTISNLDLSNKLGGLFGAFDYAAIVRNVGLYNVKAVSSSILAYYANIASATNFTVNDGMHSGTKIYPYMKFSNIFVKLTSDSKSVQGLISGMNGNHFYEMNNIVVDWQNAPAVSIVDGVVFEGETEVASSIGILQSCANDGIFAFNSRNKSGFQNNYFITSYPLMYRNVAWTVPNNNGYYTYGTNTKVTVSTTSVARIWGVASNGTLPTGVSAITSAAGVDVNTFGALVDKHSEQYATKQDLINAGKDLSSFNSYWDTTSGAPVWRTLPQA